MTPFIKLLGEENPILKSIEEKKFEVPTEIQAKAIPAVLEGKDVIGGASTGSGKTLAFAAGLIKNAKKDYGVQGLVLTPTRELAEQVATEIAHFSSDKDLNVIAVYGGVSITNQIKMLESAEIVVATPGRVLDHLERKTIDLSHINTLVLDEADRMLDMGFIDDVDKIIAECPNKRQTMLFSATISSDIAHLSSKYLKDPFEVSAEQYVDASKLEQVYYDIGDNLKYSLLIHLLENEKAKLIMIFCNTRRNVDFVANNLKFMGIDALPIHGGFSQDKRLRILSDFNDKKVQVLVTTDVAARGLDIKGVSHVYNYDMPADSKEYVHRIGRTARAGKEGKVINIISSRDYDNFQNIVSGDFEMKELKAPYIERVRIRWMPEKKEERFARRRSMEHERNSGDWKGGSRGSSGGYNRGGSGDSRGPRREGGYQRSGSRDGRSEGNERGGMRGNDRRSFGGRDSRGSSGGYSRGGDRRSSGGYNRGGSGDSRGSSSGYGNRGGSEGYSKGNFSKGRDSGFKRGDGPRREGGSRDSRGDDRRDNRSGYSREGSRDDRRSSGSRGPKRDGEGRGGRFGEKKKFGSRDNRR
jgi:superfamily II DNA/RNA helicase